MRPWGAGSRLALAALGLAIAACSAAPQPTGSTPTQPASAPATSTALASGQPTGVQPTTVQPTDAVVLPSPEPSQPPPPLPEPVLESVEQIQEVLYERAQADQVIVSLLDQLGIGLYQPDGTPIRPGAERADGDLFLFEPEARGLVAMLRAETGGDPEGTITFRDFHAALADLGFAGSAEELANAYTSAYESEPESAIALLVNSFGGTDVETLLPRLEVWLLLVDGFVAPTEPALAAVTPLAAERPAWGIAADKVAAVSSVPLEVDPLVLAHILAVVQSATLSVGVSPSNVHEGHGGPGAPAAVTARISAPASSFVSPFSGQALIPTAGSVAGVPVQWIPDDVLSAHGSAAVPPVSNTDALGAASFTYTPRQEDANGEGQLILEVSVLQATVPSSQVITALYGLPSLGALVPGELRGLTTLSVGWHDSDVMRISFVEDYDVTLNFGIAGGHAKGTDSFEGLLALQEDGTWRGVVEGRSAGSHQTQALGQKCSSSWSASQQVEVIGAAAPHALDGDFFFKFIPVSQPTGSLGSGKCPPSLTSYQGIDYAPYNDASISDAAHDQGLVVYLPPPPGGTRDYPVKLEGVVDANWHVTIEYPSAAP